MASHVITGRADIQAGRRIRRVARLAELFARLNLWLGQRRRYHTTVAKLDALPDAVLADIGVLRAATSRTSQRARATGRAGRWHRTRPNAAGRRLKAPRRSAPPGPGRAAH